MKVYGIGYQGRTVEQLRALADELDAEIVDVRFTPLSRLNDWRIYSLRRTLPRYRHVKAFGNVNYKNGGPIQIAAYEAGKAEIAEMDCNVILMCACKDPRICHRTVLLERLAAEQRLEPIERGLEPGQIEPGDFLERFEPVFLQRVRERLHQVEQGDRQPGVVALLQEILHLRIGPDVLFDHPLLVQHLRRVLEALVLQEPLHQSLFEQVHEVARDSA